MRTRLFGTSHGCRRRLAPFWVGFDSP